VTHDNAAPADHSARAADSGRPAAVDESQVDPGASASTETAGHVQDRESLPPAGQATGASGGYGVGSDRSGGGSGEPADATNPEQATTAEEQTDWLREAPGGPDDR
jgi:hypothetical protein